nr:MAG TPA: hypothetical protein [Caudoviricetes sp.]
MSVRINKYAIGGLHVKKKAPGLLIVISPTY